MGGDFARRTIVGRDPKDNDKTLFGYRESGGEEKVTLDIKDMPAHEHKVEIKHETAAPPSGDVRTFVYDLKIGAMKNAGAAAPHNNMPPYIALYFCKKVAP